MRIMYVEDNMVNLALVERIARIGGHDVVSYSDGTTALDALETDTAHLILMDIELDGELDGTQVVQKLRERGDKRPIVAVTAYAMSGDMERIMAAGCDGYLPKPVPIAELLEIIARYDPENEQPQPPQPTADDEPTPLSVALRLNEEDAPSKIAKPTAKPTAPATSSSPPSKVDTDASVSAPPTASSATPAPSQAPANGKLTTPAATSETDDNNQQQAGQLHTAQPATTTPANVADDKTTDTSKTPTSPEQEKPPVEHHMPDSPTREEASNSEKTP
jgi:two-component system, cell cycle response regulator DivK